MYYINPKEYIYIKAKPMIIPWGWDYGKVIFSTLCILYYSIFYNGHVILLLPEKYILLHILNI